jgi:glycosyltransferase involved in cell wall biosynthesis
MKTVFNIFTSLDFGGVESHAEILAKSQNSKVFSHFFVALNSGGSIEQSIREIGSEVFVLNKSSKIPSFKTIIYLISFFKAHKPDIVHAKGAEACFHALISAFIAGVPVRIGEEIGIPNHSKLAKLIFKLVYLCANKVVAISDAVASWLVLNKEVPAKKVIRIYNPVDFKQANVENSFTNQTFKIGFVGRLEPVKNPLVLVEVVANLKAKGIKVDLEFLGDGSLKQKIEKLAIKLEVIDQITLHGFQEKPENYIVNCDLYIQPSISEGFGIAIVEAMGLGVPVIASSVGGVPEIIDDGKTGWLLPDVTAETITKAVDLARNLESSCLKGVGIAGKRSVVDRFTIEKYMNNLDSLYENLIIKQGNH